MVLGDGYYAESTSASKKVLEAAPSVVIANPYDRLAAQIIDMAVVFIPIYTLISAPLKRQLTERILVDDWSAAATIWSQFVLFFFVVFVCSQLAGFVLFGQSLGKRIMKLKVVDLWSGASPSLWNQFLRSSLTFVQLFTFGISYLTVLTNSKHRGVHDQLTDTVVINVTGRPAPRFRLWPIQTFLRVIVMLLFVFGVPAVMKSATFIISQIDFRSLIVESAEEDLSDCQKSNSLDEAMALVASGYMEPKCLKEMADMEFVEGAHPSALSFLAKSFLHVDNQDLSDRYLEKVCQTEEDSAACVLARFISNWSDGDISQVENVLDGANKFNEPYLNLWALRYFQQAGHYRKSLQFSKDLVDDPKLGIYVKTQVLKAKYLMGDTNGSDGDLLKMEASSNSPVVLDTMAWSCMKRMTDSCEGAQTRFCEKIKEVRPETYMRQPRLLLSQIRIKECNGEVASLSEYTSEEQPSAWHQFIFALEKEQKGDHSSAWDIYAALVEEKSSPDYLKAEAIRRMVQSPDLARVEELSDLLASIETFEHRKESAVEVLRVYDRLHMTELAQGLKEEYELKAPSETESGRLPASTRGEAE